MRGQAGRFDDGDNTVLVVVLLPHNAVLIKALLAKMQFKKNFNLLLNSRMSNESERWNRLKTDLMNIKFNEVDQNTLRNRLFTKFFKK